MDGRLILFWARMSLPSSKNRHLPRSSKASSKAIQPIFGAYPGLVRVLFATSNCKTADMNRSFHPRALLTFPPHSGMHQTLVQKILDASFLLTVEVFLLTARLFFLRLFAWVFFLTVRSFFVFRSFLLTVPLPSEKWLWSFLVTLWSFLLTVRSCSVTVSRSTGK